MSNVHKARRGKTQKILTNYTRCGIIITVRLHFVSHIITDPFRIVTVWRFLCMPQRFKRVVQAALTMMILAVMLAVSASAATVTATANVPVRAKAKTSSTKLTTMKKNAKRTVLGTSSNKKWYKVKVNGKTGYVNKSRVKYQETSSKTTDKTVESSSKAETVNSAAPSGLAYRGETYQSRCNRIFGSSTFRRFTSAAEAEKYQVTIQIPVWKLNSSGKKYSSTATLKVHKKIAPTVKQIFKEIYQSDERFPIKDIGGYGWRGAGSSSEHNLGVAIDINPNENYMCDNSGKALVGSFWRPGKNPYSISPDSDVVRIFEKYGFNWGVNWRSRKDYMHFSYFGT